MKVLKWLDDHLEETGLVILLVLITCVMMVQVIIRKIPWIPSLTWAEEFCRFCWIWSVFLSLPYTIRMGSMLRVSVLLDFFPNAIRKSINIAVDAVVTVCMALLMVHSATLISDIKASGELSPAMLLPMWIVYAMMWIGFALGIVRGIQQIYKHVKHFGEKELSTLEQTIQDAASEASNAQEGGDN